MRELKESLSETLQAVSRGELVRVTLRGCPLADIVPAGAATGDERLRQLVAEGKLLPPAKSRPKRAPLPVETLQLASALVLCERDAEH